MAEMVDYKRIHTKKDTLEMGFNPKTHIDKYCIHWSNTKETVSVDLEGDKPIFFVQGEEALPFLITSPVFLIIYTGYEI